MRNFLLSAFMCLTYSVLASENCVTSTLQVALSTPPKERTKAQQEKIEERREELKDEIKVLKENLEEAQEWVDYWRQTFTEKSTESLRRWQDEVAKIETKLGYLKDQKEKLGVAKPSRERKIAAIEGELFKLRSMKTTLERSLAHLDQNRTNKYTNIFANAQRHRDISEEISGIDRRVHRLEKRKEVLKESWKDLKSVVLEDSPIVQDVRILNSNVIEYKNKGKWKKVRRDPEGVRPDDPAKLNQRVAEVTSSGLIMVRMGKEVKIFYVDQEGILRPVLRNAEWPFSDAPVSLQSKGLKVLKNGVLVTKEGERLRVNAYGRLVPL